MAPPRRTFFIMLITITGVLYFLYTVYTSTIDGPTYRFGSWSKVFRNLSYSSSPFIQKREEQYSGLNALINSITKMANSSNITLPTEIPMLHYKHNVNITNDNIHVKHKNEDNMKNGNEVNVNVISSKIEGDRKNGNASAGNAPVPVNPLKSKSKLKLTENKEDGKNKEKGMDKYKEQSKESVVQKIQPKTENVTVDYIVQGVITRTVYDSGFALPNVELCPDFGSRLKVVIIITSSPKHYDARQAIRQTWGHYQLRDDIAIAFIVGRSSNVNDSIIRQENDLYKDVILANFVDSYNNLTLKTVSILEWVDNFCSQAKFVLKTDDDMFINIPKLLQFIENHMKDKRKIFGKLAKKWKPIRKKASKYYVSIKQYRYSLFPDFTTGPAYLMTSDVVHDLYMTALEKTYLKLEDVYTTGIVAQEERIQRVHVNEFFNRRVTLSPCNIQKGISIHMIKPYEQYDLWKKLLDGRSKC